MTDISIKIKGKNFLILVIYIYTTCLEKIRQSLEKKIQNAPFFLPKNTPVIINIENINYCKNWSNIYHTISSTGLYIIGVSCYYNDKLKQTIIYDGLPIFFEKKITHKKNLSISDITTTTYNSTSIAFKTQLIETPVRSGQKIYAQNSDLIIINNVSSGAEIIADGNIHIYGIMRGRVLAGASGDKKSQIFCTHCFPELISIGGCYWLSDQIPKKLFGKSVRLYLQQDMLIIKNL